MRIIRAYDRPVRKAPNWRERANAQQVLLANPWLIASAGGTNGLPDFWRVLPLRDFELGWPFGGRDHGRGMFGDDQRCLTLIALR